MGCHTFLGGNPVEFTAWAREELGEEVLEALGAKLRIITRYRHSDLAEIRDHYRDQFKELKNQRERGKTGILTLPVAPVLLRA